MSACTGLQQELALKPTPIIFSEDVDIYDGAQIDGLLIFKKNKEHYMRFYVSLSKGGGSNPEGGQKITGEYFLYNEEGKLSVKNKINHTLAPNIVGGVLFVIDASKLQKKKAYTLVIKIDEAGESFKEFYKPKLQVYLKRLPFYPLLY